MNSRASTPLERAEAALAVHRRVSHCHQEAIRKLVDNLSMVGRGDIAKSILSQLLKNVTQAGAELAQIEQAKKLSGAQDEDDDLAG